MQLSYFVPENLSLWRNYLPDGKRAYAGLSLHSTAIDYVRFMCQVIGIGPESDCRLDNATIEQMLTPQIQVSRVDRLSWGLGWGIQHIKGKENSLWHFGVRRNLTRSFAIGSCAEGRAMIALVMGIDWIDVCEELAQRVFDYKVPLSLFKWLRLPPE